MLVGDDAQRLVSYTRSGSPVHERGQLLAECTELRFGHPALGEPAGDLMDGIEPVRDPPPNG